MTTVSVWCAQCDKPMMMLRFNYTSLERGFESIDLRCQYCGAEETRSWPSSETKDPNAREQVPNRNGDDQRAPHSGEVTEPASVDETHPSGDVDDRTQVANEIEATENRSVSDRMINDLGARSTSVTARQAGWSISSSELNFSFKSGGYGET